MFSSAFFLFFFLFPFAFFYSSFLGLMLMEQSTPLKQLLGDKNLRIDAQASLLLDLLLVVYSFCCHHSLKQFSKANKKMLYL